MEEVDAVHDTDHNQTSKKRSRPLATMDEDEIILDDEETPVAKKQSNGYISDDGFVVDDEDDEVERKVPLEDESNDAIVLSKKQDHPPDDFVDDHSDPYRFMSKTSTGEYYVARIYVPFPSQMAEVANILLKLYKDHISRPYIVLTFKRSVGVRDGFISLSIPDGTDGAHFQAIMPVLYADDEWKWSRAKSPPSIVLEATTFLHKFSQFGKSPSADKNNSFQIAFGENFCLFAIASHGDVQPGGPESIQYGITKVKTSSKLHYMEEPSVKSAEPNHDFDFCYFDIDDYSSFETFVFKTKISNPTISSIILGGTTRKDKDASTSNNKILSLECKHTVVPDPTVANAVMCSQELRFCLTGEKGVLSTPHFCTQETRIPAGSREWNIIRECKEYDRAKGGFPPASELATTLDSEGLPNALAPHVCKLDTFLSVIKCAKDEGKNKGIGITVSMARLNDLPVPTVFTFTKPLKVKDDTSKQLAPQNDDDPEENVVGDDVEETKSWQIMLFVKEMAIGTDEGEVDYASAVREALKLDAMIASNGQVNSAGQLCSYDDITEAWMPPE